MIVVDSSVWIGNLRNLDTPAVRTLRRLDHKRAELLLGDLILLEVPQGARDESHAMQLEHWLRQFAVVPFRAPANPATASRYAFRPS